MSSSTPKKRFLVTVDDGDDDSADNGSGRTSKQNRGRRSQKRQQHQQGDSSTQQPGGGRSDGKRGGRGRPSGKRSRRDSGSVECVNNESLVFQREHSAANVVDHAPKGRLYTVSIAIPGNIMENAQSLEMRTYLAGQIARVAAVFCVDEIIVWREQKPQQLQQGPPRRENSHERRVKKLNPNFDPDSFLARLLMYMECPQYLRKSFFPFHADLKFAGILHPIATPHHMTEDARIAYREGVMVAGPNGKKNERDVAYADVGLAEPIPVDRKLVKGVRVTLQLLPDGDADREDDDGEMEDEQEEGTDGPYRGKVVSPSEPREKDGMYWGYTTRMASSFANIFRECPFKGGYDLSYGISENGRDVNDKDFEVPPFKHLVVVFGGLTGLDDAVAHDDTLDVCYTSSLFDDYLNTCPSMGSRVIRTEESVFVTMSSLRPRFVNNQPRATS